MEELGEEVQLEEDEKVLEQEEKARLITQVLFPCYLFWKWSWWILMMIGLLIDIYLGVGTAEHPGGAEQSCGWGERGKPEAEEWKPSSGTVYRKFDDGIKGEQPPLKNWKKMNVLYWCRFPWQALSTSYFDEQHDAFYLSRCSKGQMSGRPSDIGCSKFLKTVQPSLIIWPINLTMYLFI